MKILIALAISLLCSVAAAQDYRIPEHTWNPTLYPTYRIPESHWNRPGPFYTVDPATEWARRVPGYYPLPRDPIGTVRYWTPHGWSQPYWYQPTYPCYCR